ncbi:TPA: RES domain-containing protein [Yersinia enterocolitica]|nr:RES domain-containing protein [Yersinia enterocolitica]
MWEEKYICHHCVNDVYIQNDIKKTGNTDNKCSYCNEKTETISIEELAAKVDIMLANHYEIADCNYEGEPTGDDLNNIIQEELEVDEDVASDIIESLHDQFNDYNEESKYSEEYTYSPINWHISPLNQKWDEISNSLLTEARFFNSGAKAFLDELFSDINVHSNTVIKKLNTNDPLYRARVFNDDQALEKALMHPEAELGPPPSILATPGRMNAHGVPVFYGSTSPDIAIAEVRPAVGSSVIVATFYPLRELRILDLSAFKSLSHSGASRFDPEGLVVRDKILFLRTLSNKLTIPVLGQAKGHEYLITQAVSEYLGLLQNCKLDGISFESTQVSSKQNDKNELNIVLFSKSAKVAFANNNFKQKQYEVELYDCEWDDNHGPFNIFSPRITLSVNEFNSKSLVNYNREHHGVIRLDEKSLEIHIVEGVVYKKKTYPITFSEHLITSENKGDDAMEF